MVAQPGYARYGDSVDTDIVTVLGTGDPTGYTADELASAMHAPIDGNTLQTHLEDLVYQGVLDRRGVGRGAIYLLLAPGATTLPTSHTPGSITA